MENERNDQSEEFLRREKISRMNEIFEESGILNEFHKLIVYPNENEKLIALEIIKMREFVARQDFWFVNNTVVAESLPRYEVVRSEEDYLSYVELCKELSPDVVPFLNSKGEEYVGDIKYYHWTKKSNVENILKEGLTPALMCNKGVATYSFGSLSKNSDWWGSGISGESWHVSKRSDFTELEIDGEDLPTYMWVPVLHKDTGWVQHTWNSGLISSEVFGVRKMLQQMIEQDNLNKSLSDSYFRASSEQYEVFFDYVSPRRIKTV